MQTMKAITTIALALAAGSLLALAQNNPPAATYQLGSDPKSASSDVPGQQYPKIDSERHAEFRLRAPNADRVQVDIGGHQYNMTKDDRGIWSVVTPPLVVGFHYYSFISRVGFEQLKHPPREGGAARASDAKDHALPLRGTHTRHCERARCRKSRKRLTGSVLTRWSEFRKGGRTFRSDSSQVLKRGLQALKIQGLKQAAEKRPANVIPSPSLSS